MSKVALLDPNFKVIVDYISNADSGISTLSLSQSLQDFRKQINLNWFSKFLNYDHISYLTEIWDTLFQLLAENVSEDPGLRISIFKTLGALIFALSPFIPFTTVASFLQSIQNKPSNLHLSMAIIACFCHISRYVSPLDSDSFISESPIVQCFSDLKQSTDSDNQPQNQTFYVKYLPQIILNVKPLNTEFQRFLLNALLNTFGENPTLPFIFAILNLLKKAIDPNILIKDMMQYVNQKKQQRQLTLLMISPYLIANENESKKNSIKITSEMKDDLFELAISIITKNAPSIPSFSEFEEACRTFSTLLEKESPSKSAEKALKIKEVLNLIDCPSYLKIYTFPFIDSIDELTPKEDDKLSIVTAKLSALSNFLKRSPTIENIECIFNIFVSFIHTESKEILTNLINAVSRSFSILTVETFSEKENSEKVKGILKNLKILLECFLNIKTSNFVQNMAIVNLIQNVNVDVGNMIIHNYKKISFHIVFNFCFSMHINLSETAINVLKSIIQYKTVSEFVSLLFNEIDFFDSFSLFKISQISNILIDTIGYQTVTELNCLIDPIFESLTLIHHTSNDLSKIIRSEAEAFHFFNKMKKILNSFNQEKEGSEVFHFLNEEQENELKIICFDLIGRIFESYTGINPQLPTISQPIQPVTSLIETDILMKSLDEETYFRKCLKECIIFLGCMQNPNQKEFSNEKFTELLIRLVKILPEESLKLLKNSKSSYFINSNSYLVLLFDIMKSTNSVSVASQCALASSSISLMEQQIQSFIQSQQQKQPQILYKLKMYKVVLLFITKKLVKSGRCKYNFMQYLKKVHQIYEKVNPIENEKISLPEIELDSKSEDVLYNFLNEDDKIAFIKNVEFSDWPLYDKEFSLFIMKNQEKIAPIQIENDPKLTNVEIKFIAQNWRMFDKDVIKNIKMNYSQLFEKFFNEDSENFISDIQKVQFELNTSVKKLESNEEVLINDCPVTCSSSILPLLSDKSGNQVNSNLSIPLIKNFFIFQKNKVLNFVISDQLCNQMLSLLIEDENSCHSFDFKLVISYAIDHKIRINFELIQKMLENDQLFKYIYEFSIYLKTSSLNQVDHDKLSSYLSMLASPDTNQEKKEGWFTRYLYDLLMLVHSSDKSIVSNVTNLNSSWSSLSSYCRCCDYDYYSYIVSKLSQKKRVVDSSFVLNSFNYFKELKSSQNSSFFKSVEILRNSNYFISLYFRFVFQLNKCFNYQNSEFNTDFVSFLKQFAKFIFDKAEFLVNSNFNLFSLNTESRPSLVYFFRLIESFLFNIYQILTKIQEIKQKKLSENSKIERNENNQKNENEKERNKIEGDENVDKDENSKIETNENNQKNNDENENSKIEGNENVEKKDEIKNLDENVECRLNDEIESVVNLENEIYNSVSKLVKSLVFFFHSMLDSDCLSYVTVHREIGRALSLVILISRISLVGQNSSSEEKSKRVQIDEEQIVDFIDKVTSKSGIFSYSSFFECSSLLLLSSSCVLFAKILKNNDKSIIQICKFGNSNTFVKIPSDCLSVLRSLMILIQPSLTEMLIKNFYYIFYPSVVDVFRLFSGMKIALVDIMIEKVVRRLLSNQEFNVIQNLVLPYLEKYAKEQVEQESKKEMSFVFGVANRIIDILNSAKIQ